MLHQVCKPQPRVSWKIFPLGFQPPSSPAGFAAPAVQRCTWSSAALGVTELFPELSQPRGWAACSYIPSLHCPLLTVQVQRVNWLCLHLLLYGLTFLTAPGDFFFICSQIISYSFIRVFSPLLFSLAWCFFSLLSAVMWSLYQCHYPWNPSSEWDNCFLTPADLFISLSLYIYIYIYLPHWRSSVSGSCFRRNATTLVLALAYWMFGLYLVFDVLVLHEGEAAVGGDQLWECPLEKQVSICIFHVGIYALWSL